MDVWSLELGRVSNERLAGTAKVGEISKKVQETRMRLACIERIRRMRGLKSDGDGGFGEKK